MAQQQQAAVPSRPNSPPVSISPPPGQPLIVGSNPLQTLQQQALAAPAGMKPREAARRASTACDGDQIAAATGTRQVSGRVEGSRLGVRAACVAWGRGRVVTLVACLSCVLCVCVCLCLCVCVCSTRFLPVVFFCFFGKLVSLFKIKPRGVVMASDSGGFVCDDANCNYPPPLTLPPPRLS